MQICAKGLLLDGVAERERKRGSVIPSFLEGRLQGSILPREEHGQWQVRQRFQNMFYHLFDGPDFPGGKHSSLFCLVESSWAGSPCIRSNMALPRHSKYAKKMRDFTLMIVMVSAA